MLGRVRSHLTYPHVVSTLALVVALGTGGAYASHELINSSDVVDDSLTGTDIRGRPGSSSTPAVNGSLTTDDIAGQKANAANGTPFLHGTLTQWDIKDGSIVGADIADNELRGADVQESSLAKVPSASNADFLSGKTAAQLQGARAYAFVMGNSCPGTPAACALSKGKGVAYAIRVETGRWCIGVTGIDAGAPDSVAMTTHYFVDAAVRWRPFNSSCVSHEFEVHAFQSATPVNTWFTIAIL